ELLRAAAQRLGDGGVDGEAGLLRALLAEVVLRKLIDVGGHDVEGGFVPAALDRIAGDEALGHVPGVRALAPFGGDDGQLLPRALFRLLGGDEGGGDAGADGAEEGSSGAHGALWGFGFVPVLSLYDPMGLARVSG